MSFDEKQKVMKIIRDMCGYIIYWTHCYINDGNEGRMASIENEINIIQEQVDKIKK